jgi:PhnB protein
MARAVEAGARLVTEAATNAWGAPAVAASGDPFGNIWWVTAQVETVRRTGDPAWTSFQ